MDGVRRRAILRRHTRRRIRQNRRMRAMHAKQTNRVQTDTLPPSVIVMETAPKPRAVTAYTWGCTRRIVGLQI